MMQGTDVSQALRDKEPPHPAFARFDGCKPEKNQEVAEYERKLAEMRDELFGVWAKEREQDES